MAKWARLYALLLAAAAVLLAVWLPQGGRIQTDFAALLPADAGVDELWRAADQANERALNGQILLLVGAGDAEQAFAAAENTAQQWRQSGLFAAVDSRINPDLDALRAQIRALGVNALDAPNRRLLDSDPAAYFRGRAEDAADPFAQNLLPLEQDWPGFGRFVQQKQPAGRLQWHSGSGMLFAEHENITWVLLRARLPETGIGAQEKLLPLLAATRDTAARKGYRVLAAGGALFAADAKHKSERESTLMSALGLGLTFALLLAVFRSLRVLALFVPLFAGMLLGLAAVIGLFGHIHILAVVIGTSLVGMMVDFPLHWLAPSVFERGWQGVPAMRRVLPAFCASLAITVTGYLLLAFTPLPVLRQTAVFSVAALCGAFAATVLLLPPLFKGYAARETWFAGAMRRAAACKVHLLLWPLLLFAAAGSLKSNWQDDIRDWVALDPALLADTKAVADISGSDSSGRFVLVAAGNADELLRRNAEVETALAPLLAQGSLKGVQSLNQWLLPQDEQRRLQRRLRDIAEQPENFAAFEQLGVPAATVQAALRDAAEQPPVPLEQGLQPEIAEAWRSLYLGKTGTQHANIVRIQGSAGSEEIAAALAKLPCNQSDRCARLIDKRQHLNGLFRHTRNHAAWLKLASFALAWLALWRLFGARRGSLILLVPLAASAATVGMLGWLSLPVSLFAMFGLLLVAAIGADYAVYALTARESAPAKLGGILLAALTTAVSFVLLGLSSTPAVAAFGITVSLGVAFNVLLSAWLLKKEGAGREAV